jgi:hyperosmotically inducible protein
VGEVLRRCRVNRIKNKVLLAVSTLVVLAVGAIASPGGPNGQDLNSRVSEQIRKELVTLPYYGVFDNLAYDVSGGTVTLYGQVVRPVTKSDAEHRVAKIEGIDRVINNIKVLPPSPMDDSIRIRAYRTIFRRGSLYRYAMGANPSIHIVVDSGHITLEGVVSNQMDSQLAYMAANGLPGVFSVTNNLRVERR